MATYSTRFTRPSSRRRRSPTATSFRRQNPEARPGIAWWSPPPNAHARGRAPAAARVEAAAQPARDFVQEADPRGAPGHRVVEPAPQRVRPGPRARRDELARLDPPPRPPA